jgi:hypothetical protein
MQLNYRLAVMIVASSVAAMVPVQGEIAPAVSWTTDRAAETTEPSSVWLALTGLALVCVSRGWRRISFATAIRMGMLTVLAAGAAWQAKANPMIPIVQTQIQPFDVPTDSWNDLQFNYFDPTLGTLEGVSISVRGLNGQPLSTYSGDLEVAPPGCVPDCVVPKFEDGWIPELVAPGVDITAPDILFTGQCQMNCSLFFVHTSASFSMHADGDPALYEHAGTFDIVPFLFLDPATTHGFGDQISSNGWIGEVILSYEYLAATPPNPAPEPGLWLPVGIALTSLWWTVRRRKPALER